MEDLQKNILDGIKNKKETEIILKKGFRIKGIIEGHDIYSILVNSNGKKQIFYKHSISTIIT